MVPGRTNISLAIAWALDHDPLEAVMAATPGAPVPVGARYEAVQSDTEGVSATCSEDGGPSAGDTEGARHATTELSRKTAIVRPSGDSADEHGQLNIVRPTQVQGI